MTGCKSELGIKEKLMLKSAMRNYCDKVLKMNSSKLHEGDEMWGKSGFRLAINSLYYALKTYSNFDLEKRLMRRVKCFKWRMLFMSDEAVEYEAHELARELEEYLKS